MSVLLSERLDIVEYDIIHVWQRVYCVSKAKESDTNLARL